jgi:hypothetical protein
MKKTVEQLQAELKTLLAENGFTLNGERLYDGREVYSRAWTKEIEVLWYGKSESRLEIKVDEADGLPIIRIYKNGRLESQRGYSSPKRALNAMREIVNYAGFEF